METLEYKIEIAAPEKKVWETMLEQNTYRQWTSKSWPGSTYQGKWEKGEKIKFVSTEGEGTLAELVEVKPYEKILAHHVAVLLKGGIEDRTSEAAKGWVGTKEGYQFEERNGITTVIVTIETSPAWREMFDEGWPVALEELKKITERELEGVRA